MNDLSVTIVTPSYNQRQFLEDTVESVRAQTYEDLTHIVVDGGSDDGTVELLERYPDIEWLSEPDEGQADAVNKGLERANGDIVGWVNSDDPYVYRDTVDAVADCFQRTGADIVFGHALLINGQNRARRVMHIPKFDIDKLERHCYIQQPSVFFRRHVIEDNLLDTSFNYSLDYDLWLRLRDYEWHRLDRVLAADRNHAARKTVSDATVARDETHRIRDERGIYDQPLFDARQMLDKINWRVQRVWGLPHLYEVLRTPDEQFAIDIEKPPVVDAVRTQLLRRKQELA